MPWAEQTTSRLARELVPTVSVAGITASIERARAELDAPSAAALPELVERLVRVRLHPAAGLDAQTRRQHRTRGYQRKRLRLLWLR